MNTLLVLMILALNFSAYISEKEEEQNKRPLALPVETLDDAFNGCGMAGESVTAIEMMDSMGSVTVLGIPNVLDTEVLESVDVSGEEAWFHTLPESGRLLGIGIIVYEEDTVDNRDSFMLFVTEVNEEYRWWFTIFSQNIFLAPSGQLEAWIVQEENYCGLFEISLANPNMSPSHEDGLSTNF